MHLKLSRHEEAFEEEWTMLELLGCLSVIENLNLDYYYLKSWLKGGTCFGLDGLKVLKLYAIYFGMTNEAYPDGEGLTIHDVQFYMGLHKRIFLPVKFAK